MNYEKFLLDLNIAIYTVDVLFLIPTFLLYLIGSNEDWYSGFTRVVFLYLILYLIIFVYRFLSMGIIAWLASNNKKESMKKLLLAWFTNLFIILMMTSFFIVEFVNFFSPMNNCVDKSASMWMGGILISMQGIVYIAADIVILYILSFHVLSNALK